MSKSSYNQLQFVKQTRSLNEIAKDAGIPYSTLWYYDRGERNLPVVYDNALRSYYGKEVVRRLKDVGVSSIQRERFRYSTPDKVNYVESKFETILAKMTETAMANVYYTQGVTGDFQRWLNQNYQKYEDILRTSLQKSRRPAEFIIDRYPQK